MPELNYLSLYSITPEPPKKAPIIKLSCGIGDTDGFPAFDVDSEQYATKDDSKWGFLITGGAEFHMPLTVFQVTPDGLADKGGICLGDIILEINEEDATQLTLSQAHEKINSSVKKIHFLLKSMEEEPMEGFEPGEERSIVLRVPKPPPPPKVSTIEKRLQELQRKLSEIAEIPKILSSTLATVSQTFDKLTTTQCRHHFQSGNEFCPHLYGNEQKRKLSYDEDVYDYELSDDESDADEDAVKKEQFDVKETYLQLKHYAARQRKSKDVTPESDYASESNYPQQVKTDNNKDQEEESSDNDDDNYDITDDKCNKSTAVTSSSDENDNDDDGTGKICDMYEEFDLSTLKIPLVHCDDESVTEEYNGGEENGDENESCSDDENFLTTTFTWNLRNKPKLPNNYIDDNDNDNLQKRDKDQVDGEDDDKFNAAKQKSLNKSKESLFQKMIFKDDTPEKEQKLDKLERSWPWADREKIIYKQSTCHLVPHKPLGLIEQRIQLLAKRNLLEHINKTRNPQ